MLQHFEVTVVIFFLSFLKWCNQSCVAAGLFLTPMLVESWKIPHPQNVSGASQQNNITALITEVTGGLFDDHTTIQVYSQDQDSTTQRHLNKFQVPWTDHFLFSHGKL